MKEYNRTIELGLATTILLRYRFIWHCLFWLSFLAYEGIIWGLLDGEYSKRLITSSLELPVKILATYFTLYVLIDKFLLKRKYSLFLALLLLSMVGFGVLLRIVSHYTIYPIFYPDAVAIPLFFLPKILIAIFVTYSIVAIASTFHLIKQWYIHQQATQKLQHMAQQLEKEKLEAELKLLKSQINPHFLFNTLNNLYALSLNNSTKTPQMVYKLSQLMSYMLHDSNQPKVPLKKEIEYIENYITLEKIRYGERLDVSLNVYEEVEGITIAPLLILPFVENSFKHGVSNQIEKGWVQIDILVRDNKLVITVENSKGCHPNSKSGKESGLGLQNVKKRLDLIYHDQYELQILDEKDMYLVILKLELQTAPVLAALEE